MAKAKKDTPAATEGNAAAAAAKLVKPASDRQNGVTRPAAGTKTGRVWAIADDLSAKAKNPAKRKDVLDMALGEGIPNSTGATQYGKWRKYHGLGKEVAAQVPAAAAPAAQAAA